MRRTLLSNMFSEGNDHSDLFWLHQYMFKQPSLKNNNDRNIANKFVFFVFAETEIKITFIDNFKNYEFKLIN